MLSTMPKMNDFLMWPTTPFNCVELALVQVVEVNGDIFNIRRVRTQEDVGRGFSFSGIVEQNKSPARPATNEEIIAGWAEAQTYLLQLANETAREAKIARARADAACRAAENFTRGLKPTPVPA